jgi:hypothetical protein
MNNKGESIILWQDYRSGEPVLYAQLYDRFFNPVGNNFIAASDISQANQRAFYARSLSDGSFILCCLINESNRWSIVLKKISPEGEVLKIKTVAELGSDDVVFSFNINADDEIMVSWFSNVNYIQNGITRIYNKDLLSISSDISFFDSATDENINMPKITVNKNNNNNVPGFFLFEAAKDILIASPAAVPSSKREAFAISKPNFFIIFYISIIINEFWFLFCVSCFKIRNLFFSNLAKI